MLERYLMEDVIKTQQTVKTWQEAVTLAGELLVNKGLIDEAYIEAMIEAVHTHGPYIAIAPGIAIAHAAPGKHVNEDALSLVTLKEPVNLGHETNDPITLFFVLAAKKNEGHLAFLQELVGLLSDEDALNTLMHGNSKSIMALLK